MTSFDEAADEIYGAPPKDFVATRTALVARARREGDRELATRIAGLRRPTTSAWLVNLLVREAEEQIAALLDLGAAMRRAQSRLSADELRRLTTQRQQVLRALAGQAHALAADRGERVSRDVLHQVQDTLQAALADPGLADQVRRGRLSAALSYSGFGPAGLTLVRSDVQPDPQSDDAGGHDSGDDSATAEAAAEAAERAERERLVAQARQAVDLAARAVVRANRAVLTATETVARADRDLARAEQSVAERQAALDEALAAAGRAGGRRSTAAQEQDGAQARAGEAQAELARATLALRELGRPEG